jgi:hypothetical protein
LVGSFPVEEAEMIRLHLRCRSLYAVAAACTLPRSGFVLPASTCHSVAGINPPLQERKPMIVALESYLRGRGGVFILCIASVCEVRR